MTSRICIIIDDSFSPLLENNSVWTRKCYGLGSFVSTVSTASENLDGIPFATATIAIKPAYDQAILEPAIKNAWIALRHSLPAIAVKSSRLPAPDNYFTHTYHVPKNFEQVQAWVHETLFFTNEVKGTVYEVHNQVKNERWWRPANGHWVGELHVSPLLEGGWQFSVVFNHNSTDGRSIFVVLNELLAKLVPILEGSAKPVSELRWGEETKRLPPAAISILAKENIYPYKDHPPLSQMSAWTWPPAKASSSTACDLSALVTLPVETTSKLHAISKLHGRTITTVINALSILAHTEASLAAAAKVGPERFKILSQSYKESEVYKIAFTLANYVGRSLFN